MVKFFKDHLKANGIETRESKATGLKKVTKERSDKLCMLTVRSQISYRTIVPLFFFCFFFILQKTV